MIHIAIHSITISADKHDLKEDSTADKDTHLAYGPAMQGPIAVVDSRIFHQDMPSLEGRRKQKHHMILTFPMRK